MGATYAHLSCGSSQGAYIILLQINGKVVPQQLPFLVWTPPHPCHSQMRRKGIQKNKIMSGGGGGRGVGEGGVCDLKIIFQQLLF